MAANSLDAPSICVTLTTKTCTNCKSVKPLEEYHRMKRGRGGLKAECKTCINTRNRARWNGEPYTTKIGPPLSFAEISRNCRLRNLAADPLWERKRMQKYREADPKKVWSWYASARARSRARDRNVPYSISPAYLQSIAVDICPVLGFPLVYSTKATTSPNPRPDNPSVDCIIPGLGYVPGNVAVISRRANVIKNDATADEVMRVAVWLTAKVAA